MSEVTGVGYSLSLDLADSTTYVEVDVISVDESFAETVDTYFKLSDEGFSTNVVTALDPSFNFIFKFDKDDVTLAGIVEKRFTLGDDRNVGYSIIDNGTLNTITGSGVLTSIGTSRTVGAVVEVPVTMKFRGAPTIAATT